MVFPGRKGIGFAEERKTRGLVCRNGGRADAAT